VGEDLTPRKKQSVIANRNELMRKVFYRYASSRADSPLVDKHDIEHALETWSWFWACVEAVTFFGFAGIVAHLFHDHTLGVRLLIITGVLFTFAVGQYFRLDKYTRAEIAAIASDATAANDVRATFNAL
jgi:hypothetical protein